MKLFNYFLFLNFLLCAPLAFSAQRNVDPATFYTMDWDYHQGKGFLSVTHVNNRLLHIRYITTYINAFGWENFPTSDERDRLRIWNDFVGRWSNEGSAINFSRMSGCNFEEANYSVDTPSGGDWFQLILRVDCEGSLRGGRIAVDLAAPGSSIREVDVTISLSRGSQTYERLPRGVGEFSL